MNNLNMNADGNVKIRKMNVLEKITGVVVSPSETMRNLAIKPGFWLPVLLTALCTMLLYITRHQLYQQLLRDIMEMSLADKNVQMTPEQFENAVKMAATFGLFSAPVGILIKWLAGSAVIFGLAKLFKGQGSFRQYLSITGYSNIIIILFTVLTGVVSFFSGSLIFDTSMANITNFIMPDLKGSFIYGVIRGIDLFLVWQYIVTGIGVLIVSKLDSTKVYFFMTLIYIVTTLMNANSLKFM